MSRWLALKKMRISTRDTLCHRIMYKPTFRYIGASPESASLDVSSPGLCETLARFVDENWCVHSRVRKTWRTRYLLNKCINTKSLFYTLKKKNIISPYTFTVENFYIFSYLLSICFFSIFFSVIFPNISENDFKFRIFKYTGRLIAPIVLRGFYAKRSLSGQYWFIPTVNSSHSHSTKSDSGGFSFMKRIFSFWWDARRISMNARGSGYCEIERESLVSIDIYSRRYVMTNSRTKHNNRD